MSMVAHWLSTGIDVVVGIDKADDEVKRKWWEVTMVRAVKARAWMGGGDAPSALKGHAR